MRQPDNGAAEWERCKPWLAAALEYGADHYSIDDVYAEVLSGDAQFWPGRECAGVTQVWTFPQAKALNYWLAGGDLRELVDEMLPCVERFAAAIGCKKIIVSGRGGWAKVLKPLGYRQVWVAQAKDLEPATEGRC